MNICVAGDVHGRIDKFYENIRDFELKLKISFDVVLQVGDFGVWIDEKNHDGITKLYGGTGDFPKWHKGKRAVPIKTYFINGNNEDFNFLEAVKLSGDFEILKNLFYVPNGTVADIKAGTGMAAYKSGKDASLDGGNTENLVVAGIGGKYDPEYFNHREADRYYTKYEINNLIKHANGNIDIFISHDAPEGVLIEDNDKKRYYPKAAGLRELILKIKPKIVFFGHHHGVCKSEIEGIPVYGLNVLGEKDSLLGFKIKNGAIKILGKY